jgi:hypothetical protein
LLWRSTRLEPIHRKAMRLCAYLLIMSTAVAAPLAAQSLADVARHEAERRQAVKDTGKSYTNKDLKSAPAPAAPDSASAPSSPAGASSNPTDDGKAAASPSAPAASGGSPDAAADAGKDAKTDAAKAPVRDQAYWSKRAADLREKLSRDQVYMDALQSRINALTTDFVNRDDPIQRSQIGLDRQRSIDELARLKKGIEEDKKGIADLEEEARHANVPPGWLR